jgi:lipid-binding SYLF domain-containing protein
MKNNKKIKRLVNRSYVYIAFPSIKKGGILFGYARGDGRAYNHGKWIGNVTLSQYSFGALLGGQAYSEIIFFETPEDFKNFTESGLISGTQASIVGAAASASGDVNINSGVQVFTSDGAGLMLEASFSAQDFIYEAI